MKLPLFFLFFIHTIAADGQKIATIYYDSEWNITTREECTFFRTSIMDTANQSFSGEVKDYYRNGKPQMRGAYYNKTKVDTFFFYYPNGNLESKGFYIDNSRNGIWKYFHPNGQLKQVLVFSNNDFQIHGYYDSLGNALLPDGNGIWHNEYRLPEQSMWIRIEGKYEDWKRDGKWKVFTRYSADSERLEHTDYFKDGILKGPWYSGTFQSVYLPDKYKFSVTEKLNYSVYVSKKNYPYIKKLPDEIDSLKLPYDENAAFPGGEKELQNFLRKNLKYPGRAKQEGIEKYVTAEFTVTKNGEITNIRAEKYGWDRKKEYGFEEELTRVIQLFPKWTPAKRNNEPVPQRMSLIVNFNITKIEVPSSRVKNPPKHMQ